MTQPPFSSNGHAPVTLDRQRDLPSERARTAYAAQLAGAAHVERLVAFAEHRAARGPLTNFLIRDFALEALEELADTRNYLVWWLEQLDEVLGREPIMVHLAAAINRSLGLVALAYEQAEQAQQLAVLAPRPGASS